MGSISFSKGDFVDHLHDVIGQKAGIAVSVENICDLLIGTGYDDTIIQSEDFGLRIRSEEYEDLYYELLHKVGTTEKPQEGIFEIFKIFKELEKSEGVTFCQEIQSIYSKHTTMEVNHKAEKNDELLNPTAMMKEATEKYGKKGLDAMYKLIVGYNNLVRYSPHSMLHFNQWDNIIDLNGLFSEYKPIVSEGVFLDQRFLNYLSVNSTKLGEIHWRKFEELTAECFSRFGFQVELGPGSNDDGVDVRVWQDNKETSPLYIVQCKRIKSKIDKVTIKGLYADTIHESGKLGVLVTTSEFSVGARKTISARKYPIQEINGNNIKEWLKKLRTPGTGIIRC